MTDMSAHRARWAVSAMFLANGFVMGAWAPQIPLLLPRHGIGEGTLGLLILVLGMGAVGSMLFTGRLIARHGSLGVLRPFSLALIPVLPVVVYAPNLWVLAPAMAALGALIGCMDVSMNANAVEVERRLGQAMMSSCHGFWSLGGFVGGIGGSYVIAQVSSGAQALATAAIVAAIILTAMRGLWGEPPHPAAAGPAAPKHALLPRSAALWILGAMALFSMVPEGAVLDWAALYLGEELSATPFVAGLGFALFSGTMAVMRFAGDAVRNRLGAVQTLRLSGALGAAGLMVAAVAPVPAVALLGFMLAGLGVANMVPILFSAAGNFPGLPAGSAIASVTMLGYAGLLVAPATIGWLAEHFGYRPTYAGLSLLLALVAGLAARAASADGIRGIATA
jgi:MFS family permease